MKTAKNLIIALDTSDHEYALDITDKIGSYISIFKVGNELFTSSGPRIVEDIRKKGKKVFLDLKFHDIPNTVSKASVAAARLGVHMFNIHASGGLEMMKRSRDSIVEVCLKENLERPKILAVTVLTSISREMLKDELGIHGGIRAHVKHLSQLAQRAGLDGVVASAREINTIRSQFGKEFLIVTPGIRPSWTLPDDQKRTMTPQAAIKAGADYIVMGRGIMQHPDPLKALELVNLEILAA
jgi:orotidine-5'-phosphate decarboxylase